MKSFAFILFIFLTIRSFAFDTDKILGTNDLVAVNADGSNIPSKYKNLINAFGIISMGCTATHIGNGYVLTAGHCVDAGAILLKDIPCSETTIEWGVREGISPFLKSTCEKVVFAQRDSDLDFAILKVSPAPDVSLSIELVRKATPGDSITVFSHPLELPLRWSQACVVESQLDPRLSATMLQHNCDTNSGSSGAVIIDTTTNKIVGIHDGGRESSPGVGKNYGTFITNVVVADALKQLGFN